MQSDVLAVPRLTSALAAFGLTVASVGGLDIELDTAVRAMERVAHVLRALAQPDRERLDVELREWGEAPGASAAVDDYRRGLDLFPAPIVERRAWSDPPAQPAYVARRLAVLPCRIGFDLAREQNESLRHNAARGRWELPSPAECMRAETMFERLAIDRIGVRLVPAPGAPSDLSLAVVDGVIEAFVWLMQVEDRRDSDVALGAAERLLAAVERAPNAERAAVAHRVRAHLTTREHRNEDDLVELLEIAEG